MCCSALLSCLSMPCCTCRSVLCHAVPCRVGHAAQDIRRIVRNDARIMNKLHRRVFLDKIGLEDVKVYISFYVEASNRDNFMAVKQVSAMMSTY